MWKRLLSPRLEEPLASVSLLVLRLGVGGSMLATHAVVQLRRMESFTKAIANRITETAAAELAWTVTAVEVVCSILLMLGLFTRVAAMPLVLVMLGALAFVHRMDPWDPMQERAVLYMLAFTTLVGTGAGKFSLDAMRDRQSASKNTTPASTGASDAPAN